MPCLKLFLIKMKMFQSFGAFIVVPRVAEQNSSNIPEDGVNVRHLSIPLFLLPTISLDYSSRGLFDVG